METETTIDVFKNPFLNVDIEKINKWDKELSSEQLIIVPKYEFRIISETKISKKEIVWALYDDFTDFPIPIFQTKGWKEIFVWDEGSLVLQSRESDSMYLDLVVGQTEGCSSSNLLKSREFIYQIAKHIDNSH